MRKTPGYRPGRARLGPALMAIVLFSAALRAAHGESKPLPALRPAGAALVDEAGRRVTLRGCNLGNWLLLEPWMMGLPRGTFADQHAIFACLEERFGKNRAEELLDLYRTNWIGPREFEIVRSFKFNLVRVPFHHGLLATEDDPFTLRPDAFEWLDRAVELAEAAGVYVILDMHGAPGGQSHDMPTGHAGQNRLLTDEACQKRTAWMWQRIAERYRNRASVIAYDLLNEPWGDFKSDIDGQLVPVMQRIHAEIRAVDPDKLVLLAGSLRGIRCYGDPASTTWRNVGFTEHYYPGLFGQGAPDLETHAWFLAHDLVEKKRFLQKLNVPYLVGEFNVVYEGAARPEMMRRYFDFYADAGWMATMWSLRVHRTSAEQRGGNWPVLTNAELFALPDFRTATEDEIVAAFQRLGEVPLAVDGRLRDALTAPEPPPLTLARFDLPPAPTTNTLREGWQSSAIGTSVPAAVRMSRDERLAVWAGGRDIFGKADGFQFVHQQAPSALHIGGVLEDFRTPSPYAKAGCMLRASVAPDAAHASVLVFPDGRIMATWRSEPGGMTYEHCLAVTSLPADFGLERGEDGIRASYEAGDGLWKSWTFPSIPGLTVGGQCGWAVNAQHETALAYAEFSSLFCTAGFTPCIRGLRGPPALLDNGNFDLQGPESTTAQGWEQVGKAFQRASPPGAALGEACVRFSPERRRHGEPAALVQEFSGLAAGTRYTFSIAVRCAEQESATCCGDEIELRLEAPMGERQLQVASRRWRVRALPPDQWNRIFVSGTWPGSAARVSVRVDGPPTDENQGDWLLDAAEFRAVGPVNAESSGDRGAEP